jgi:hypothetical protein
MPSDHSSSSHSSSSSSSSSGSSHSGSSGGYSGGSSGGYSSGGHSSYHDNDSFDNHHYSDYWSPVSGLFWFVGIAVIFIGIILNVNIDDELNKNNNSDSVIIYQTVSGTGTAGEAGQVETTRERGISFKKYSPGYGIIHDKIYVPEIRRDCTYDAKSDNYYDKETDCYFWLNNNVTPPVWQYWYEGISSDYGDYGWMEYDYDKKCWFVETEKGKWEELPSYYDTSKLWHMDKPTSGRYQGKDSIYVPALGRDCPYKEYVSCYYDEETNTYFYYNSFLRPAQWLYWYDDYGWLMYDSQTAKWYHLGEYINGISWNEMSSDWKDPKVWHFSNN